MTRQKRQKGQPHDPPTRWDRVLDKAASKMFPPDTQGKGVDEELRKLADSGGES